MARKQNTTTTISDKDWNRLGRRARRTAPHLEDLTAPHGTRRPRQSRRAYDNYRRTRSN